MDIKTKSFYCDNGIEIMVGMDDTSNDELSLKMAHPMDLWFHANGVPGSHVLLCCGKSGISVEKECIRLAASIAAWYSKMRNARKVSVHYCLAGDVKKPKGAKPGSVTIKKAKKIMAEPELPVSGNE